MCSLWGRRITKTMADVLDVLADGEWHAKKEISEKTGLKQEKLEAIISFLRDYGFIVVDADRELVRLNEKFRMLLLFQEVCR